MKFFLFELFKKLLKYNHKSYNDRKVLNAFNCFLNTSKKNARFLDFFR